MPLTVLRDASSAITLARHDTSSWATTLACGNFGNEGSTITTCCRS